MTGTVYLLRKEAGVSSFRALYPLKREIGTAKVGHTGTLDPFAEGLLVVLSGYATRLAGYFSGLEKRYLASCTFGASTDTLDPEGTVEAEGPIPEKAVIESVLDDFVGEIEQTPPAFSAIRVGGKRAYRAAREGKPLELASRAVLIRRLTLVDFRPPIASFDIICSKGTYVRTLAKDIAHRCGTVAHVSALSRVEVGPFSIDEIGSAPWKALDPVAALARVGRPVLVTAEPDAVATVRHGGKIDESMFSPPVEGDGEYAVVDRAGSLVAVITRSGGDFAYRFTRAD